MKNKVIDKCFEMTTFTKSTFMSLWENKMAMKPN